MAVTIKDVAALAGVSPSTVSRVCTGNASISKETRDRVKKIMTQLGYESGDAETVAPRSGLKMLAVVLPAAARESLGEPFFMETIRGVCEFCNPRQIATTVVTGGSDGEILQAIRTLAVQADGFIMLYAKENDPVVDYLCENGLLYVVVGTPMQLRSQTTFIDNDNLQSAREATDYLYELGHRRIGFLGGDPAHFFERERKAGYQLSMLQHGLPIKEEYSVQIGDVLAEGTEKLKELMALPERPTAVVADKDALALALVQVCIQMGISVPEDLSIIAYNNSLFTQLSAPGLTCLDVNSFQLGYEAASQILNHAENPNLMATKIVVPHRIVERSSCRRIDAE